MNIISRILFGLALALPGALVAADQMTAFNSHALMKFEKTSLQVSRFDFPELGRLDDERTLRICEALDNSKLLYFGSKFDIEHRVALYNALFASEPVKRSLSDFLVRGGLVFFSPLTWTQLNSWPQGMKDFFRERGVTIPDGSNCVNTSDKPNCEYQVVSKIAPEFAGSMFEGPRATGPIKAIRQFGRLPDCWKNVYVSEKEGWPVMVAADCRGGGRVVFSHVFTVDRIALSPFYLNLIEGLYGAEAVRARSSRTVYLEKAQALGLRGLHLRQLPALTRVTPDALPADASPAAELREISFTLARNDRELAEIALYNCSEETLVLRLEPDPKNPMHDMFSFDEVLPWMATNEQVYNEIVTGMNGAGVIVLPPGETRLVLLAAKTDRAPGVYDWSFSLVPVNCGEMKARQVRVKAEVLDLRLEEQELPPVYTFGPYTPAFTECTREECWDVLAENHISVMQLGEGPNTAVTKGPDGRAVLSDRPADYLSDEAKLQARGLRWVYGYRVRTSFLNRLKSLGLGHDWSDPEVRELFRAWAKRWAESLRGAGIELDRCWAQVEDEPRTPAIPALAEAAAILQQAGIRTAVTIATWGVLEDYRIFGRTIDLWFPWESRLTRRPDTVDEEIRVLKGTGKPWIPYLCSMSCPIDPYLDYFRFRGIRTQLLGGDGLAMWAANSWRGNEYYAPNDTEKKSAFLIHHGDKPVGTMRLEMFREGIEDLYWIRRAAASGKPAAAALVAEAELKRLIAADDAAAVIAWRERLLRTLAK